MALAFIGVQFGVLVAVSIRVFVVALLFGPGSGPQAVV